MNYLNILYWDIIVDSDCFEWHCLRNLHRQLVIGFRYKVNFGSEFISLYVPICNMLQSSFVEESQFQKSLNCNVIWNSVDDSKRKIESALLEVNDRLKFVTERELNFL